MDCSCYCLIIPHLSLLVCVIDIGCVNIWRVITLLQDSYNKIAPNIIHYKNTYYKEVQNLDCSIQNTIIHRIQINKSKSDAKITESITET